MTDFFSCQLCFCQKLWHFIVFCLFKVSYSLRVEGSNVTFSKYIVGFILRYFSLKRVKYFRWNYMSHRILIISIQNVAENSRNKKQENRSQNCLIHKSLLIWVSVISISNYLLWVFYVFMLFKMIVYNLNLFPDLRRKSQFRWIVNTKYRLHLT